MPSCNTCHYHCDFETYNCPPCSQCSAWVLSDKSKIEVYDVLTEALNQCIERLAKIHAIAITVKFVPELEKIAELAHIELEVPSDSLG